MKMVTTTGTLVENEAAADAVQDAFAEIARTLGISFVPDLFRHMAAHPAYLEVAWGLFKEDLALDLMDLRTKRIIALAISTTDDGTYCITAYPDAFIGIGVDSPTIEKVLFSVQLFSAFSRFLSGVRREHVSQAVRVVNDQLRQEATRSDATMPSQHSLQKHEEEPAASWAEKMIILTLIVLILAAGAVLVLL